MHNVDVEAVEQTAARGREDEASLRMPVQLSGDWHPEGGPQFRATIPYPQGEVELAVDFPPPMGGTGAAPNPLAYCFFGGLACYAMSFATEAARDGVEVRALHATVRTEVDQSRALGLSDRPPVERIEWELEVDADASAATIERLKAQADDHCPGAYCLRNPIALETRVLQAEERP
ncbi:MAG TPA: OsmC family protein [Gaiellaceae bacterium]|nr:OsmC family protein [Gaiellaceae bacterium]